MVIDSFGGTPFLDNVGEEFMKKFFDAVSKLEMLRNEFFREDDPDSDKYYERYKEEIGDFFTKLRFPALRIPEDTDLALVSIGSYDFEDYWGCHTYNFLVDKEYLDDFGKVGEAALRKRFEDANFYENVIYISPADFVRMEMFRHALKYGVAVYREFCPTYGDKSQNRLYEEFVDRRYC